MSTRHVDDHTELLDKFNEEICADFHQVGFARQVTSVDRWPLYILIMSVRLEGLH